MKSWWRLHTKIIGFCVLVFMIGFAGFVVAQTPSDTIFLPMIANHQKPQRGGTWVEASIAPPSTLNPLFARDKASFDVMRWLYPTLLGIDANSGVIVPTEMAERWDVSTDGKTWTFHLRDGVNWSDGNSVDASDFKFTYDAIASDTVGSIRKYLWDNIERIEVIDPLTLVVTFKEIKCDSLTDLSFGWLPSHLYASDFSDIHQYDTTPPVSAGPFILQKWEPDQVVLVRNEGYWKGAPYMDGWVFKAVADAQERLRQLQNGMVDRIDPEPNQIAAIQADSNLNLYSFPDDGYSYVALNLANPNNPQSGRDSGGNLVSQDPHPLLGELAVRQAIVQGIDYDKIIDDVYGGQGYRLPANVLPSVTWAYSTTLQPYTFDPTIAAQTLENAGWRDTNGDGIREKNGQTLALTLTINAGSIIDENLSSLLQNELRAIGFDIQIDPVGLSTLFQRISAQTFDMFPLQWFGLGSDPDDAFFWHTKNDNPGQAGGNHISYHNPTVDRLLDQGNAIPGCASQDRAPYYKQIQQIIHDDIPRALWIGAMGHIGYSDRFQGIHPGPWDFYAGIERWSLK